MYAWAVGKVAEEKAPPSKRAASNAANSSGVGQCARPPQSAKSANPKKLTPKPSTPASSTRLRPTRSLKRPQNGPSKTCIRA